MAIPSARATSFQYAADFRKLAAQAGAEACQCDDERDRYQTGDQCIFDSRDTATVLNQSRNTPTLYLIRRSRPAEPPAEHAFLRIKIECGRN